MPIVNATSVPYGPEQLAGLPQAPTQVPGDYQRIPTEPAMFGALQAQALEKVGTTLETASDRLAARAIEAQTLHNEISAHAAFNGTQDTSTNILYGSPDNPGYLTLQGKDALDQYPVVRDKLTKLYADARNTLQNPHQQLIFDNEARRNLNYQLANLGRHYDTQQKVLAKETNATSYNQNLQGAMNAEQNSPEEAERIHGMMTAGLDQLRQDGRLQDPQAVDEVIGKVRADVTKGWAQKLGVHDAIAAAKYVEENKDVLGTHYPALANEFRAKAIEQGSSTAAHAAMGGPGGGGEGLVPYTPATGLLEGTGLTGPKYDIYRRTTASEESKRYDEPPSANPYGYMGRYQMGGRETAAKRGSEDFNEIAKAANRLGIPEPTTQEFLSNPKLQEQLFENYTLNNHNELMQKVPQYRDGSPDERAALLMGAHIGGVGGVIKYLKGGEKLHGGPDLDPSDGHRTVGDYINIMRQAMKSGGPASTVISHTPTPGTAGGPGEQPPPAMGPTPTGEPVAPTIPPPPPPAPPPKTLTQIEADAEANATKIARDNNFDPIATQQLIDGAKNKARAQYNLSAAALRQAEQTNLTVARAEVIAGNNGEPFRDIDAYLADPDRATRFRALKPEDQGSIRKYIADYATAHVPVTDDRLRRFETLKGMAQESPADFLQIDPLKEDLPNNMKNSLVTLHNQIIKGIQTPPDTAKAMATLTSMGIFEGTGINKTDDPERYHQFYAGLDAALKEEKQRTGKPIDHDATIKIGMDLLKVSIPGSWFFNYGELRQFETLVPKDESDAIIKDYRAAYNASPTPAQVLAMYHQKLKANAQGRTAIVPPAEAPPTP